MLHRLAVVAKINVLLIAEERYGVETKDDQISRVGLSFLLRGSTGFAGFRKDMAI